MQVHSCAVIDRHVVLLDGLCSEGKSVRANGTRGVSLSESVHGCSAACAVCLAPGGIGSARLGRCRGGRGLPSCRRYRLGRRVQCSARFPSDPGLGMTSSVRSEWVSMHAELSTDGWSSVSCSVSLRWRRVRSTTSQEKCRHRPLSRRHRPSLPPSRCRRRSHRRCRSRTCGRSSRSSMATRSTSSVTVPKRGSGSSGSMRRSPTNASMTRRPLGSPPCFLRREFGSSPMSPTLTGTAAF